MKKCDITHKGHMFGNSVSHAQNKTRRKFKTNIQEKRFFSHKMNRDIKLSISNHALRIIDKFGTIDSFLLNYKKTLNSKLSHLKKQIV